MIKLEMEEHEWELVLEALKLYGSAAELFTGGGYEATVSEEIRERIQALKKNQGGEGSPIEIDETDLPF